MLSGYGSGFVYISRELLDRSKPRAIGWLSVEDPYGDRNDEIRLRHDAAARAGWLSTLCRHVCSGSVGGIDDHLGHKTIELRALELNRILTDRLSEAGWKVLSPISVELTRSAETLVQAADPAALVARLAERKIIVTKKPQGIRVATHFFNHEADIDQLMDALGSSQNRGQ